MPAKLNLSGQQFGRLTAIRPLTKRNSQNHIMWLCQCQCGKKASVSGADLQSLKTRSCGCYRREVSCLNNRKHGDAGKIKSRLYRIWHNMKKRCSNKYNKDYKNYGGRGIKVCKIWANYVAFKKWALAHGYRDDLQIDRIRNNGNYKPSNCRWVTRKENQRNTRQNRRITINGETKSLVEWCEIYNVSYQLVYGRLRRGWGAFHALTKIR